MGGGLPTDVRIQASCRIGWIPYWNLHPLRCELARSGDDLLDFRRGHPTAVNRWLSSGAVDLAPCSSVCLVSNPHHELALPIGVAAQRRVGSVYLAWTHADADALALVRERHALLCASAPSPYAALTAEPWTQAKGIRAASDRLDPVDPHAIPRLRLTPASAASAMLTRLLFRLWFGEDAYGAWDGSRIEAHTEATVELLIGDEALARRSRYPVVMDLATLWYELTGLPFVFAVWQRVGPQVAPEVRRRLTHAAEIAQARMRVEPGAYLPCGGFADDFGEPVDLCDYWRTVYYRLGPAEIQGLSVFLALTRSLMARQADQNDAEFLPRLLRWRGLGEASGASYGLGGTTA